MRQMDPKNWRAGWDSATNLLGWEVLKPLLVCKKINGLMKPQLKIQRLSRRQFDVKLKKVSFCLILWFCSKPKIQKTIPPTTSQKACKKNGMPRCDNGFKHFQPVTVAPPIHPWQVGAAGPVASLPQRRCVACNAEILPDAKFCRMCGKQFEATRGRSSWKWQYDD